MGTLLLWGKKPGNHYPGGHSPDGKILFLQMIRTECIDCSVTAYSIEDALGKCEKGEEIFIIGGGSVYRQFMPIADRLYITHVHRKAPADIYFPEIDLNIWEVVEKEEFKLSETYSIPYTYIIYRKKKIKSGRD